LDNAEVMKQVIAIFLIILVGVYASRRNIITDEINKGLTTLLLKVIQPILIMTSFNFSYSEDMASNVSKAFLYGFIVFVVTIIISYIFLIPVKGDRKKVLQFANTFSNCAFMGFPVINSIYGAEGIVYAAIFNMYFAIFLWSYGIMLYSDKLVMKDVGKVFFNPGISAVYIGLTIMFFDIQLPEVLLISMRTTGSMTTPLAMIIIGAILAKADIKSFFKDWTIYYETVLKLIVIPIVLFALTVVIGEKSKVMMTMIILQAMPAAAMTSIFAENFNKEKKYAAVVVFITTLFSIVTFPLILRVIM
jgi:malate permease and related proteins